MKKIMQFTLFSLGVILLICCSPSNYQINQDEITIRKIWSNEYYNSFTSLIYFNDNFYCAFRQGTSHAGYDTPGVVRIIKSKDGKNWESVAVLEKNGIDLRDPTISVTPNGRIMVITLGKGSSFYKDSEIKTRLSTTYVSFSNKSGENFSETQPINVPSSIRSGDKGEGLYRGVTWHNKTGYGVLKQTTVDTLGNMHKEISLVKTVNGIDYELIKKFEEVGGNPNESTVRVMPDGEMIMMVRRDIEGLWGRSKPPYKEWTWIDVGMRFGGPDFIALNDSLFIAGTRVHGDSTHTGLFLVNRSGKFRKILRLPSGGDTSYPGFVVVKDKTYVSYYSSHEDNPSIFLVEIPLSVISSNLNP